MQFLRSTKVVIVQSETLRTLQPLYQCRVTDRVEGCGEIEANKQCDILVVSRSVAAVKDIEQRRLGRVSLPVGRLPLAQVLGIGQVDTLKCQHKSLEHLGDCR